jgi:hypothetical protein
MLLWPGIQLFGCVAVERKVRNGCLYTVESTDAAAETLRLEGVDTELTFDQAKGWLRLSYATMWSRPGHRRWCTRSVPCRKT